MIEDHICQGNPAQCLRHCCKCCAGQIYSRTQPNNPPELLHLEGSAKAAHNMKLTVDIRLHPFSPQDLTPSPSGSVTLEDTLESQTPEPVESPEPTVVSPAPDDGGPTRPPPATVLIRRPLPKDTDINIPQPQPKPESDPHKDSFQELGMQLFNTWPYRYFKNSYKPKIKSIVRLLCLVLFAYHFLAMTLITMCEDGSFQSVFDQEDTMYYEVVHRLLMFALRVVARVVIPAVCLAQFTTIAAEIRVPKSGLSRERAIKKLLKVHEMFSPRDEAGEIRRKIDKKNYIEAFGQSTNMAQRHIKSMWIIPIHSVLFTGLLLYLGVFFLAEEKIMMEGVCNLKFVNTKTVALPIVNIQVLLILLLECISIFFTILLVGVTKEFYTYENRIATCAVVIGGEAAKLYTDVRRRWRALDCLCYFIPVALAGFVVISFATGKPFTPDPPHELKAADLATWYFWVFVLSVLTFLASSTNRTIKKTCIIAHIFAILFICMGQAIEELTITPAGASIIVLLFTTVAVLVFNLLYSLCRCHMYHWLETCDRYSCALMLYCGLCMCVLPLLVIATAYREVSHLAHFIAR